MRRLKLDNDNLSLCCGDSTIRLLRKEFQLFQYLFDHVNRAFSREQLLDAVWGDENPVDRTVDDHVYRIRKKLQAANLHTLVSIETVRGRGYRLVLQERVEGGTTTTRQNASVYTDAYKNQLREMYHHYVRSGHGAGVRALAEQSDVFGLSEDVELLVSARFHSGDFREVLNRKIPFATRLPWMLFLYDAIERNVKKVLRVREYVAQSYLLPIDHHRELYCFQFPMLYLLCGEVDVAYGLIQDAAMMSDAMEWDGYIPAIRLYEVLADVYRLDLHEASEKMRGVREILKRQPWQREMAHAQVIEGYLELMRGHTQEGIDGVLQGLNQLEQLGLTSHVIIRTNQSLHVAETVLPTPALARELRMRWAALSNRYYFDSLIRGIETELAEQFGFDFL